MKDRELDMRSLYNFLFTLALLIGSPILLLRLRRRGNWRRGFAQRFGRYDAKIKQSITNRDTLWIHAVSVGEVHLCQQLVAALEERLPNLKIVISTTTSTGMQTLRDRLPPHVTKIYYPVDRRKYVLRALSTMHPKGIVLVEAEIWPNFLWRAAELRTPVFLVNARVSDRSYRGYRLYGFLFRKIFQSFARVCCPTETDRERLLGIGCRPASVDVVGNVKYDTAQHLPSRQHDAGRVLERMGVKPGTLVIVAGSTHPGEEVVLGRVFQRLRSRFPELFLILVPRHFERSENAMRELESLGLNVALRRVAKRRERPRPGRPECLLVNTTGELRAFYDVADVVFVGKSLTAEGGQNPIEPAFAGKPVITGPHMQNFRTIVETFNKSDAMIQVRDEAELEEALAGLLSSPALRNELGARAKNVVLENSGAIARTADAIARRLAEDGVYAECL